ncbi:MAG: DUF4159 domain-containing protein [Rhodospirillaceae bacterium]
MQLNSRFLVCTGLVLAGLALANMAASAAELAVKASERTWLGYIATGDEGVDQVTRAGLEGLLKVLSRRTAVDTGGVAALDVESDELSFFPLLYWVVTSSQPALSSLARARVNSYLRHGGTVLFDTRDARSGGDSAALALRGLTEGLELPALTPVPADHVLTRAFYLLKEFPGRTRNGEVWVEASEERRLDGVSSIIIGGNDWAGAWAMDADGRPLSAAVPGGERQREIAYRFGVNVVMYALTGNYKADQVHVPAILQRIGR